MRCQSVNDLATAAAVTALVVTAATIAQEATIGPQIRIDLGGSGNLTAPEMTMPARRRQRLTATQQARAEATLPIDFAAQCMLTVRATAAVPSRRDSRVEHLLCANSHRCDDLLWSSGKLFFW